MKLTSLKEFGLLIALTVILIAVAANAARVNPQTSAKTVRLMQDSSCTPTPSPTPGE
jgi:hypothetical protein